MAFVREGEIRTGYLTPEQCARGRTDCRSLAQIITRDKSTFMCCGELAPDASSPDPRDRWSFCHRSIQDRAHCAGVNIRMFVDKHDLADIAGVISMGLAVICGEQSPPSTQEEKAG